ncbi:MAG: HRDC domain-containing protein [Candidatus Cryptobacteroides sp.]
MTIQKDRSFLLAERYVQETGVSVFLTGKAGTGKTTFLQEIVSNTCKRCAVVAPTGVAAMNAGGVTIHSFFQLPLCPYLPDVKELVTEYQLPEKRRRVRKERIDIYRTLDLLVIDEISMVRADILDAVDAELRRYRRNEKPFGGVQLLMIGDVQQLPPVVKESEKQYFGQVYSSPFFFCSKAFKKLDHIVVELGEIHRQKDRSFTEILNDIRSGRPGQRTLDVLNSRLDPFFEPPENEKWVRLTTHNAMADAVNRKMMDGIDSEEQVFEAEIRGVFPENAYPAETSLRLKTGAQVMFIRNDSGEGRWYNGKIGTVSSLDEDLRVTFEDGTEVSVDREEWKNLRYELNPESNEIEAVVDGVFVQYPLRPAWAITIHKSQGLTFDKVIIDAGKAFSFGQVYVALSRCRTLEGIVLSTPISGRCTFTNPEVDSFEKTYTPPETAAQELSAHLDDYYLDNLCDAFDLRGLRSLFNKVNRIYQVELSNLYPSQADSFKALASGSGDFAGFRNLSDTCLKFHAQIRRIAGSEDKVRESALLKERVGKAAAYFHGQICTAISLASPLLLVETDNKETRKAFQQAGNEFLRELRFRLEAYSQIGGGGFDLQGYRQLKTDYLLSEDLSLRKMVNRLRESAGTEEQTYSWNRSPEALKALLEWRRKKCEERGVPLSRVLSRKALNGLADSLPSSREDFLEIKGLGIKSWNEYGEELLEVLKDYRE